MVRYFSHHLTFSIYLVTQLSNSIHNNASTVLAEEVLRLVSISKELFIQGLQNVT